jgi:hypothetical protein
MVMMQRFIAIALVIGCAAVFIRIRDWLMVQYSKRNPENERNDHETAGRGHSG